MCNKSVKLLNKYNYLEKCKLYNYCKNIYRIKISGPAGNSEENFLFKNKLFNNLLHTERSPVIQGDNKFEIKKRNEKIILISS